MATFHRNQLTIAAYEPSMKNVLLQIANNLETRRKATHFDADLSRDDSVLKLYRSVYLFIDNWYWLIFSPVDEGASESESMRSATEPLSDTAVVSMGRRHDLYVLSIWYDTPWSSNKTDVLNLIDSLPDGDYGFAFFDADERDAYWDVNVLAGQSRGNGILTQTFNDVRSCQALWGERLGLVQKGLPLQSDPERMAYEFAVMGWSKYQALERKGLISPGQLHKAFDDPSFLDEFEFAEQPMPDSSLEFRRRKRERSYLSGEGSESIIDGAIALIDLTPMEIEANVTLNDYVVFKQGSPSRVIKTLVPGQEIDLGSIFCENGKRSHYELTLALPSGRVFGALRMRSLISREGELPIAVNSVILGMLAPHLKATVKYADPGLFLNAGDVHLPVNPIILRVELGEVDLRELLERLREEAKRKRRPSALEYEGGF